MKVKVGNQVKILTGKDKGKEGKIIKTLKKENKVVVEGINIVKKHLKPGRQNETGSIQEIEAPIHASNVKLVDAGKSKKEVKASKAETKKPAAKKETKKSEKKAS